MTDRVDRPEAPAVHWFALTATETEVAELATRLPDEDRQHAASYTHEGARRRFVVARTALRRLLGERLDTPPGDVPIAYGPHGKPTLADAAGPHFNVAHSGEWAVIALADQPVGVDVERFRPMASAARLAERWFHPSERRRIAASADALREFFAVWVAKEAALKLVGLGVGESLPGLLTPAGSGWATGLPVNEVGIARAWVVRLPAPPGYAAAVATREPLGWNLSPRPPGRPQ